MVATMVNADERVETLEQVLELFDEAARLPRSLHDPRIEAYCLADLEGRAGGWLGHFVRDVVEETLEEWRSAEGDE